MGQSGVSKGRKNYYEAMFLVSQATAHDLAGTLEHLTDLIQSRAGGEILGLRKWDERRLAFEIQKQKRGVYFLAYFAADPANLPEFERVANISEHLMRFMVTRADHLTVEEMQAADARQQLSDEAKLKRDSQDEAKKSEDTPAGEAPADAEAAEGSASEHESEQQPAETSA